MNKFYFYFLLLFLLSSCDYGNGYRVSGNQVLYERPWNTGAGTQIIKVKADYKTFETLGGNNMTWARDKDFVFNEHHILEFLDRDTFIVLNNDFGKDHQTVVCGIKPISQADVSSFKLKDFVDLTGKKRTLGIDKNAVYLPRCGKRRVSSSLDEFTPIKNNFYKDATTVSWGGTFLPKVNAPTFRLLEHDYSPDGKNVYHYYDLINGADVNSFEVIGPYKAKDKNYSYKSAKRIE
jgi:hypothetical protein